MDTCCFKTLHTWRETWETRQNSENLSHLFRVTVKRLILSKGEAKTLLHVALMFSLTLNIMPGCLDNPGMTSCFVSMPMCV